VHEKVRRDMPNVSLKTVYQTLNDLAELGAIAVLDVGPGSARFDPNVETTHHHLVCRSCGKVRDVAADFSGLRVSRRATQGFDVDSAEVVFRGLCDECKGSQQDQQQQAQPITNQKKGHESTMPALKGSKTEANLKEAFAGESQANRRYLYFAQKADVEGYPDVAALFRSVAEGETGHAFGHFDFLKEVGDPVTGVPVGATEDNLKSAIEGETYEYTEMYPGFAKTARDEGYEEIAEWLETLAKAEKSHAGRFTQGLESVS
jgi:rubrerythrin/Fe2+ or Zn2+ uptake regulation protein